MALGIVMGSCSLGHHSFFCSPVVCKNSLKYLVLVNLVSNKRREKTGGGNTTKCEEGTKRKIHGLEMRASCAAVSFSIQHDEAFKALCLSGS